MFACVRPLARWAVSWTKVSRALSTVVHFEPTALLRPLLVTAVPLFRTGLTPRVVVVGHAGRHSVQGRDKPGLYRPTVELISGNSFQFTIEVEWVFGQTRAGLPSRRRPPWPTAPAT